MINVSRIGTLPPGLGKRLEPLGIYAVDGVLMSNNDAQAQAIIDAYTLADCKAERKAESSAIAKQLRDKVVETYSVGELASWSLKLLEAQKVRGGGNPNNDAPMLKREAEKRGVTIQVIIDRVIANAAVFSSIEADIAGANGKHHDLIDAQTTFAAVLAYDITSGWPVL